jgi:hypothetical protein
MTKRARNDAYVVDLTNFERECVLKELPAWTWFNVALVNRPWLRTVRERFFDAQKSNKLEQADLRNLWFHMPGRRDRFDCSAFTESCVSSFVHRGHLHCLQTIRDWHFSEETIGVMRAVDVHYLAIKMGQLHVMKWVERAFANAVFSGYYDSHLKNGDWFARACVFGHLDVARHLEARILPMYFHDERLLSFICKRVLAACIKRGYVDIIEYLFQRFNVRKEDLMVSTKEAVITGDNNINICDCDDVFSLAVAFANERVLRLIKGKCPDLSTFDVFPDALKWLVKNGDCDGLQRVFTIFGYCRLVLAIHLYDVIFECFDAEQRAARFRPMLTLLESIMDDPTSRLRALRNE